MIISVDGYKITISAKSEYIRDDMYSDERAMEVINRMICIINLLETEYENSTSELNREYAKVLNKHSNELFRQLEEKGFYESI